MARDLQVDETVFVPASSFGTVTGHALYSAQVLDRDGRRVRVEAAGQQVLIDSSKVHRDLGVLVITMGDFRSEPGLLNPLSDSIIAHLDLLFPPGFVFAFRLRTLAELIKVWEETHPVVSHVILVAHGGPGGFLLVQPPHLTTSDFVQALSAAGTSAKVFLNLACETGRADFGNLISKQGFCSTYMAPFQAIHGAEASLFCQLYLRNHFLHGLTSPVAYRNASKSFAGTTHFRRFVDGRLVTDDARNTGTSA